MTLDEYIDEKERELERYENEKLWEDDDDNDDYYSYQDHLHDLWESERV